MEEFIRCEEREKERSTQAWEVISTSRPGAALRRRARLEPNQRMPQATLFARREARKGLPEQKTGREARDNKPNEAVADPRRGKDPRLESSRQQRCDDFGISCKLLDRQTLTMTH